MGSVGQTLPWEALEMAAFPGKPRCCEAWMYSGTCRPRSKQTTKTLTERTRTLLKVLETRSRMVLPKAKKWYWRRCGRTTLLRCASTLVVQARQAQVALQHGVDHWYRCGKKLKRVTSIDL